MFTKMDNSISYFLQETGKEFHVRQVAKLEKKSPTTIAKQLREYAKEKLLVPSRRFNHLFYKANMENPIFRDMKIAYNIAQIRNVRLIEFLEEEFNNPEAIVLFGSFRKGDDNARSDIDLAVISSLKKEPNLSQYEKQLGHKIQILAISDKDIDKMKDSNRELLNNIINSIVLYGFFELFR